MGLYYIYPDLVAGDNRYAVSLRSAGASKNVAALAEKLGGGGHKPAAGAKLNAPNVANALDTVLKAIENNP